MRMKHYSKLLQNNIWQSTHLEQRLTLCWSALQTSTAERMTSGRKLHLSLEDSLPRASLRRAANYPLNGVFSVRIYGKHNILCAEKCVKSVKPAGNLHRHAFNFTIGSRQQ